MDKNTRHLFFLKFNYPSINFSQIQQILDLYENLELAYNDDYRLLNDESQLKLKLKLKGLKLTHSLSQIDKILTDCEISGIKFITVFSSIFPQTLLEASPQPLILFYIGNISLISKTCIAIVGARDISFYSKQVMDCVLSKDLSVGYSDVCVVSGLALGVDAYCHNKCIEGNIKAIAVIGSGFKQIYPVQNIKLFQSIVENGGLVLSQFFPDVKPLPYHFPIRNQIIVLLSRLVWVVQAKIKSGSYLTANLSLEFGVNLATTPANIFDPNFSGNIQLIKNGSSVITNFEDMAGILNISTALFQPEALATELKPVSRDLSNFEKQLLNFIKQEPKTIDEIEEFITILKNKGLILDLDVFTIISTLELDNLIEEMEDSRYFSKV